MWAYGPKVLGPKTTLGQIQIYLLKTQGRTIPKQSVRISSIRPTALRILSQYKT